jgi:hypothetical protein
VHENQIGGISRAHLGRFCGTKGRKCGRSERHLNRDRNLISLPIFFTMVSAIFFVGAQAVTKRTTSA